MSKTKVKLNSAGVRELLKSKEMQEVITEHATSIKGRAGDGYEQDLQVGKNRANAMVWAETSKAKSENFENNTLLKAVR